MLNLYLLQRADDDYGKTYRAVVAASDETTARILMGRLEDRAGSSRAFGWVDDAVTTVEHIGEAIDGIEPGVIITKESAS